METKTVPLAHYKTLRLRFFQLALEATKTKTEGQYLTPANPVIAQALREAALANGFTIKPSDTGHDVVTDPNVKARPARRPRSTNKGKAAMKSAATEPYPPAR